MTPSRLVTSGHLQLAVYEWGQPNGQPSIVLVHGYPDSAAVWQQVAKRLSSTHHVIAYDVRGAGSSGAPTKTCEYALEFLVADLAAVLDAASPQQPVHLACHDWGSIQCWEAVTTPRLQARILSYTSISGPSFDHAGFWVRAQLARGWRGVSPLLGQLLRSWYMLFFQLPLLAPLIWKTVLGKLWPRLLWQQERVRSEPSATRARDGANGVGLYRANLIHVFKPRERYCKIPVQLLIPLYDRFVPGALFEGLERWAPDLRKHEIKAGHWVVLSYPEWVAQHIAEFVSSTRTKP